MRDLLSSSARPAILTTPGIATAASAGDTDFVCLSIAYDCFDMSKLDHSELQWTPNTTLGEYLADLPAECEWGIVLNNDEMDLEKDAGRTLNRADRLLLILIPQGGGGGLKKILMAAAAAAMIVAGIIFQQPWLIYAGVSMAMGLASQMLLMPKKPKTGQSDDNSYGIDGAKNSATEGIPYPVLYGEFRFAGNYADCYTVNVGDDQYLYLRSVINDGEIDSITDIEVNEQPIANFKNVEVRIAKGTLTEPVNDWFTSSIVQVNKGIKLTQTFTEHTTTSALDKVRFDIVFPMGLMELDGDGDKDSMSVTFEVQYRLNGTVPWLPMPIVNRSSYIPKPAAPVTTLQATSITAETRTPVSSAVSTVSLVEAVNSVTAVRYPMTPRMASYADSTGLIFDVANNGTLTGPTDVTPISTMVYVADVVPEGTYNVETSVVSGPAAAVEVIGIYTENVFARGSVKFSDNRTKAIRKSIESGRFPVSGIYDVRIRRTNDQTTYDDEIDEVHLADVAEIELDPVAMRGTATLSLKIKLNDQLNGLPQLTAKVKASLCNTYDRTGTLVSRIWTNNPSWCSLDAMLSQERGALLNPNRIDWPRWVEFAEHCTLNSLTFNGVFSEEGNVADAAMAIARIGHGAIVPFGTKISVCIDAPREPVHVFTQANIIADSFSMSYMSMTDRANEFEFSYFDKTDRNKQKTIRYVDPKAVLFSETPRSASVSFAGVDNIEMARKELWRSVYINRLLIRAVQFDSWLDSINMTLGEVALIHHDMMEWATSGRLKSGSTTLLLNLDQPAVLNGSSNALVHYDALQMASTTINSVGGKTLTVVKPGGAAFTADQLKSKRVIIGAQDLEIARITNGASFHTIELTATAVGLSAGNTIQLWDTDVLCERPVASVLTLPDGTARVTLSTPLPSAPPEFANFAFGPVVTVKKPYVLVGVSGNGLQKRKLSFKEYHEGIYGPAEVEIPTPVASVSDKLVAHVRGLVVGYDSIVEAARRMIPVTVKWNTGGILNYAGADVFVGVNGSSPVYLGTAHNASQYEFSATPDDRISVMVIAFNKHGNRAPIVNAPECDVTIGVIFATLAAPTALAVDDVTFEVDGTVRATWVAPVNMTGVENYEVQFKRTPDLAWTSLGLVNSSPFEATSLPTGTYDLRVRSNSATSTSVWVSAPFTVAVAPGSLMANFNAGNDRNAAAIPTPTLPAVGIIEHTLNADSTANISLEWLWSGDNATIDGFIIDVDRTGGS